MITSKMTSKAQTTIPQAVRMALNLRPGDEIAYQIEDGRVILMRTETGAHGDDPFATFSEWDSEADKKAYANL
ncbi:MULTISPECIES: AbrB/MazE/SpoVT family DNA-binding domain-containing protein [Phyllobacterium]|uniref:Antitoxin PrlF n=1 Tax=Phyllobacterium trifolii TaxID=300193 RepID=A0A839UEQ8_9HYPH|nr:MULTISPECIES: type II toxin-antitoxin system PrlF family antitoxin [Phyllobacterium]MBB3146939.1 antitoxin PrlF [Phyllobacterium trifolii]MBZ9601578.1 type II toxin-antitoxin system PrlF family antitoxin [Phyllobacterium sp. KW56]